MAKWVTHIQAFDPYTGNLRTWAGPDVPGETIEEARDYCQKNGLGYCNPVGEKISEEPACFELEKRGYLTDFQKMQN